MGENRLAAAIESTDGIRPVATEAGSTGGADGRSLAVTPAVGSLTEAPAACPILHDHGPTSTAKELAFSEEGSLERIDSRTSAAKSPVGSLADADASSSTAVATDSSEASACQSVASTCGSPERGSPSPP